jgi:alpha-glucosidase
LFANLLLLASVSVPPVVPLNVAEQRFAQPTDSRGFMVAPYHGVGIAQGECFEDDGESEAWRSGEYSCWKVSVESDAATPTITVNWTGQ